MDNIIFRLRIAVIAMIVVVALQLISIILQVLRLVGWL